MTSRHWTKLAGSSLAVIAAVATLAPSTAALAQTSSPSSAPQISAPTATPPAPAPDPAAAQAYADQYARWAGQNCVDQRTGATAAGAIVGGALGAIAGAALSGGHAGGALAGGAVGAVTGAAVGSTAPTSCPPGYVVRAGAPAFVYAGPPYDPALVYGPGWGQPWVRVDGRWVYRPYAYWVGPAYPRPYWAGQPWVVRHRL